MTEKLIVKIQAVRGIGLCGMGKLSLLVAAGMLVLSLAVPRPFCRTAAGASSAADLSVSAYSIPGLSSDVNNVQFALGGRFALVAPFAPSTDNAADNHFIYVQDVNNPSAAPVPFDLTSASGSDSFYYPARLAVSSVGDIFVRATDITTNPSGASTAQEALVVAGITSAPDSPNGFAMQYKGVIQIPAVAGADSSLMPADFGIGGQGKVVVFTNGAEIFSVTVNEGFVYPVSIIPDVFYNPLSPSSPSANFNEITSLTIDPATDIIAITVSSRTGRQNSSEVYFYHLHEEAGSAYGTIDSVDKFASSDLPGSAGAFMTPGSNAVVSPDGKYGFFATNDGSVWKARLNGQGFGSGQGLKIQNLGAYASIAANEQALNSGPRTLQLEGSASSISVTARGHVLRIKRPTYSRGGGIKRPTYIKYDEAPGLVIIRAGSQVTADEFTSFGDGDAAISNPAFAGSNGVYLGTSNGELYSISGNQLASVGNATANLGLICYDEPSGSLVGISSFSAAGKRLSVGSPGALVLMDVTNAGVSGSAPGAYVGAESAHPASAVGGQALPATRNSGAIKRPCSLNR